MKHSIITVTYNCASTIERTIKSVLSQEDCAYEYIVIDGASTDGTAQIIDKYRDKLAYYVSEPDSGMYEAMNKGLRHVTGDLVLFLNGDDYLVDNTALSRMVKHYVDENTILIGRLYQGEKLSPDNTHTVFKSKYYGIFYPHQATFVPKALYDTIGGFDESYRVSADFEWICRAMLNGYPIEWVDEIVSVFSVGGLSSTIQCKIDEYNISNKYMTLSKDPYMDDMVVQTVDKARSFFFRKMLVDEKCIIAFQKLFENEGIIGPVQLWGAGAWASYYLNILRKCNISVDYIFDSDKSKREFDGISIMPFDKDRATYVIVSTENYDDEVAEQLRVYGLEEKKDFLKFHTFRDNILTQFDREDEEYISFISQTGLNV
ncbi:glycosyltransferase family 2 protein [Butyrivibrio sp. VCB2006]|uniref:glycosyltransferase family 2 protein n=1 Tax=Butyrivibrio sp. VCB2006 TaxID=1280679 RepID=UPI0004046C51|nr:glycosyltransferase family 2 protein [Butyrivibrio sp. VCB2006]